VLGLVLLTLVSRSALVWLVRLLVEAWRDRDCVRARPCPGCGELVNFRPPFRWPTRAELYGAAGVVTAAAAAAEGIPAGPVAAPWENDHAARRPPEPATETVPLVPPRTHP